MKNFTWMLSVMVLIAACKKESTKQDCEINNYGTLKINFLHTGDNYKVKLDNVVVSKTGTEGFTQHSTPGTVNLTIINIQNGTTSALDLDIQACKETVITSTN